MAAQALCRIHWRITLANGDISPLVWLNVTFSKSWPKRPYYGLTGCGHRFSLGRRLGFLGAFVPRQERFEICAAEFSPPVDDQALRQAVMLADALPHHHHAGVIARFLEVHMQCQDATRKRIDQQGHPWPAELVRARRVGQFRYPTGYGQGGRSQTAGRRGVGSSNPIPCGTVHADRQHEAPASLRSVGICFGCARPNKSCLP